jgi:Tol biopolymer transport system component
MTLDTRARRAAQGIRNAVEVMEMSTSTKEPRKVERFDRFRDRKQRNRRIGALLVAALLVLATVVAATIALKRRDATVPATPPQNGRIVFEEQARNGSSHLSTMNPGGTDIRDLTVASRCMSWAPDGSKILIGASSDGTGLATVNPDGTGYTELDVNTPVSHNPECGAFSPDGTRIVFGTHTPLEADHYSPRAHGIFTARASDGGDLVRLTSRNGTYPSYSPDGEQVVFQGVQGAHGACLPHSPPGGGSFTCPPGTYRIGELDGSVFVVNADGTGLHRVASHMAFLDFPPSWSPDGRWILFSGGRSANLVQPDGTGLRRITLETVPRLRYALYPSWSPDGTRFVFVGDSSAGTNLFTARKDGSDVEQITHSHGTSYFGTAWGTNAG